MQAAKLFGFNGRGRIGHQVRAFRGFRERDAVADARPGRDNWKLASHNVAGVRCTFEIRPEGTTEFPHTFHRRGAT